MESGDLALGLQAPHFELPEPLTGKTVSLDDSAGAKAILIMFICNHCPFVIHLERVIVDMVEHFKPQGLQAFGISANSVKTHPQDAPEKMAEKAKTLGDDLRGALEDVLAGRPVQRPMRNSVGCGIKWHPA